MAKWVKKCGNGQIWPVLPVHHSILTGKEQQEQYSWGGGCCSNLLVHTEATHPPTSSVSVDQPVELVFGLAEHSNMKKDIRRRHRVWPETALSRGCVLLHYSICWVRSGVRRRTRSCSSRTDVRTAEREAVTVSAVGRNSETSVDFISFPVCFKRFTYSKRLFKLWLFLSYIQENC